MRYHELNNVRKGDLTDAAGRLTLASINRFKRSLPARKAARQAELTRIAAVYGPLDNTVADERKHDEEIQDLKFKLELEKIRSEIEAAETDQKAKDRISSMAALVARNNLRNNE